MVYINYGVQRLRITGYRLHADLNIFNYTLVFCLPPTRRAVILSDREKDLEITINLDYDKTNIISRGKAVTRISNRILSLYRLFLRSVRQPLGSRCVLLTIGRVSAQPAKTAATHLI